MAVVINEMEVIAAPAESPPPSPDVQSNAPPPSAGSGQPPSPEDLLSVWCYQVERAARVYAG